MGQYFTNDNLSSKIQHKVFFVLGHRFVFFTDNGVFSKTGLDFGSRLLLETIPLDEVGDRILDMGCGYGVIGIILNKVTSAFVDMVDINERAIHLAKKNIRENQCLNIRVFQSNIYENVFSKYMTIVTNPPIRAGKKVVYDMVLNAKDYLKNGGNLFLVVRKEQGAKSLIVDLEKVYTVEVLARKKGYYIIKCIL